MKEPSATAVAPAIKRRVKLILIRHGETDENARQIIQGHKDTELNENGLHQAEITRDYLMKDLQIKPDTADIIVGSSVPVIEDERIKEKYLGALEGTVYYTGTAEQRKTIEQSNVFTKRLLSHWDSLFPSNHGQSSALAQCCDTGAKDLTVIDVSHGGTIKTLVPCAAKQRNIKWDPKALENAEKHQYRVWNCSITIIEMQEHETSSIDDPSPQRWTGTIKEFASVHHFELAQMRLKENTEADTA